jgi:hypothetical protein
MFIRGDEKINQRFKHSSSDVLSFVLALWGYNKLSIAHLGPIKLEYDRSIHSPGARRTVVCSHVMICL